MIKRKLFTLLTLLLFAVAGAMAQETFSVAWAMGESADGTATPATVASDLSYSVGDGLLQNGTKAFSNITFTQLDMNATETGTNTLASAQSLGKYVEYSFVAGEAITLSNIGFDAVKFGTNDPQAFVTLRIGANGDENTVIASAAIRRNNDEAVEISQSYNLTDVFAQAGDLVTLRIYIGKLGSGKNVGIANVSITGTLGINSTEEPTVHVDAESVFVNFSEIADGLTIGEPLTLGPVTFVGSETKYWYAEGNSKTFDCGTQFTIRMKSGGAANAQGRYFTVDVAGPCTLEFYAMSGSSNEERTFNITKGSYGSTALASLTVGGKNLETVSYRYTGSEATTLYVIPQLAINFYGLSVIYNDEHPAQHTYYLTGEGETFGNWEPAALELTDCSYTLSKLPAGEYQFQLTQDGTWDVNYGIGAVDQEQVSGATVSGTDNVVMTLNEESNVTISLNGGKIAVAAEATVRGITVAEALAIISTLETNTASADYYRITATVSSITSTAANIARYGNADMMFNDGDNEIKGFRIKNLGNTTFASIDDVPVVGSQVIVYGQLENYNGTPEILNAYIEQVLSTPEPAEGITFSVTVPKGTPAVYIAGSWNDWGANGFTAMEKVDATHYTLFVEGLTEDGLEYKYLCGEGWEYMEVDGDGNEIANRTYSAAAGDEVAGWLAIPEKTIHDVTVAEALEIAGALASGAVTDDYYRVTVTLTEVKTALSNIPDKYTNINCTIEDETGSIPSYYTNYLNNEPFTSADQVPAVGTKLVIVGPLTNYRGTTAEFTNGYIEQILEEPQPAESITFTVEVPEGTPAVYICGAWDEWATFIPLEKVEEATGDFYTVTIEGATENHGYKYLCGEDWDYVEVDAEGNDIRDRVYSAAAVDEVAGWKAIPGEEPEEVACLENEEQVVVFFENTQSWNAVKAYAWAETPGSTAVNELLGGWPGSDAELVEGNIYRMVFPATAGQPDDTWQIIFNDGTNQTANLVYLNHYLYNIESAQREITAICEVVEPVMASGTVDFYVPGENAVPSTADAYYELPNADNGNVELDEYTKEAITVKFVTGSSNVSMAYKGNPPTARWYNKNSIEITVKDYTMTKIEFMSQYNNTKGLPTASTGEITGEATQGGVFTWTGVVTDGTLTLTNETGSQLRFSHMIVTYGEDVPEPPTSLTFNVTVPENTPAVYICGAWDEWAIPTGWPMC